MRIRLLLPLMAALTLASSAAAHFPGDVNLDGLFDASDARLVLNHLAGNITLTKDSLENADLVKELLPGPTKVSMANALLLLRLASGALNTSASPPPAPPLLDAPVGSGNPVTVTGTCEVGSTLLFFVTSPSPTAGLVNRAALSAGDVACESGGTIPSTPVYLLFEGQNQIHAIALKNGYPSRASNLRFASYTNPHGSALPSTISGTVVLTSATPGTPAEFTVTGGNNLIVSSGSNLVVGPGVVIEIGSGKSITVNGALIARGAPGDYNEVTFRAASGTWIGIVLNGVGSDFDYVKLQNASIGIESTRSLSFRNGEILVPQGGTGLEVNTGSPVPQLILESSRLLGTRSEPNDDGTGNGVQLVNIGTGTNLTSTIRGNEIADFQSGVRIQAGARHLVDRNEIRNNEVGIRVLAAGSNQGAPQINRNKIHDNAPGIEIQAGSTSGLGSLCTNEFTSQSCWLPDVPTIRWNQFSGTGHFVTMIQADAGNSANSTYPDVINRVIDAQENDWGFLNVNTIMGRIDDRLDDPPNSSLKRPLVSFTPFRRPGTLTLNHNFHVGSLASTDDMGAPTGIDFANHPEKTILGPLIAPLSGTSGKTSVIPSGAVLNMNAGAPIVVLGALTASGTTSVPVTIKGDTAISTRGFWKGIQAEPASANLTLSHVKIQDAETGILVKDGGRITYTGSDAFGANPTSVVSSFSKGAIDLDACGNPCRIEGVVIDDDIDHLAHSETTGIFGIRTLNASPLIVGNFIREVITGIHLRGTSITSMIENNRIGSNVFGLWIEEVGGNHPNPTIRLNRFENNSGASPIPIKIEEQVQDQFCSTLGAALCLSGTSLTGSPLVLNAKDNYWGVNNPDPATVRSAVTHSTAIARAVDQGLYWNDPDRGSVGGDPFYSTTITGVSVDKKVFSPLSAAGAPDSVTITFTLLKGANVALRIYRERDLPDGEGPPAVTPVREITMSGLPAGTHQVPWDGRDGQVASRVVPDEVYTYVLSEDVDETVYNPRRFVSYGGVPSDPAVVGDIGAGCSPSETELDPPPTEPGGCGGSGSGFSPPVPAQQFEPVKNNFYEFNYRLITHPQRGIPFDSRVTVEVRDGGEGGPILAKPWDKRPIRFSIPGNDQAVAFAWNGRSDSTGEILPPNNGSTRTYFFGYLIPQALKPNSVLVSDALPVISGESGAGAVDSDPLFNEVKIDPYLVHHSYDQVSTVAFQVNRTSAVKIYILPPGKVALGDNVQVIDYGEVAANLVNTVVSFEWAGHPHPLTPGTSDERGSTADGLYTFVIEATAKNGAVLETNLVSLYRGAIQVRQ